MRLLISTPLNFLLLESPEPMNPFAIDRELHITTIQSGRQEDGNGNYQGITWDSQALYVTSSQDYQYLIRVFDRDLRQRNWIGGDLHQPHQALHAAGKLWITNTGKNRLECWDGRAWQWYAFNPSPCDIDHVNGIWFDGSRFWITEFRHRPNKPSVVRVCDGEMQLQETMTVGPPIHNVYIENNRMFNLVSRRFKGLLETNLATGETARHHVQGEANNLVRGLARTRDRWLVGLSRWEPERGDRHKGDAVVVFLDNAFREVDRWVVADAGPVCEVRVISEPDLAHNGVPW